MVIRCVALTLDPGKWREWGELGAGWSPSPLHHPSKLSLSLPRSLHSHLAPNRGISPMIPLNRGIGPMIPLNRGISPNAFSLWICL